MLTAADAVAWIATGFFALATGLAAQGVFQALPSLLAVPAQLRRRRQPNWLLLNAERQGFGQTRPTELMRIDEILGLANVPWTALIGLGALLGVAVMLSSGQTLGLLLALVPIAARRGITEFRRRELEQDVWAFLLALQISLPQAGTVYRTLLQVAESPIQNRLVDQVRAEFRRGAVGDGLDVLRRLAAGLKLPPLLSLVSHTEAALGGTLALPAAFAEAMDVLQDELATQARERLESTPFRLLIFSGAALLAVFLVVALYPPAWNAIEQFRDISYTGGLP